MWRVGRVPSWLVALKNERTFDMSFIYQSILHRRFPMFSAVYAVVACRSGMLCRAMKHFQSLDYRAATVDDDDSQLDTVHQNTITYVLFCHSHLVCCPWASCQTVVNSSSSYQVDACFKRFRLLCKSSSMWCPMWARGNPPLYPFTSQTSTLLLASFTFPFSLSYSLHLFSCFSIPLHSTRIVPHLFQAGCRRRRLNMALVFFVLIFCYMIFYLRMHACFCHSWFSFVLRCDIWSPHVVGASVII